MDNTSIIWSRLEARRGEEKPILVTSVMNGYKEKARYVNVVLYAHNVLAENNEQSTDAEYEIISINASMDEVQPMTPETLKRNHFGDVGGTNDNMSDEDFKIKLEESEEYWSKYANADHINNFKLFYEVNENTSKEELSHLIKRNCSCKSPEILDQFIANL